MKSTRPMVVVLAVAAVAMAACSSSSAGGSGGHKLANGKSFTMLISSDPGSLDPSLTSLGVTNQVDRFLYDSLVNIDQSGAMVPGLAATWQGTATTATFTLRKGITCSDGTALTASDVAANITFVANPKNQSPRLGTFVPAGAQASANDAAGTVTITSPTPDAFLDRNVGGLQIVCPKGLKDRSLLKQGADGTGMFTLSQAVAGDHYTMTRRKNYAWGPTTLSANETGLPDQVTLKVVANETTAANLVLSGAANVASFDGPDQLRLRSAKLLEHDVVAPLAELFFNQAAGHDTASEAVRSALVHALDLTQLGQVFTSGAGKLATGLVAPGVGPCNGNQIAGNLPAHSISAAKSALDAAGWVAGAGGVRSKGGKKLSVTVLSTTTLGSTMQSSIELMQQIWKGLGVAVTLKPGADTQVDQTLFSGSGNWDVAMIPLSVQLPSQVIAFVSGTVPPKGTNFASIQNPTYTTDVRAAQAAPGAAGCKDWDAAEQALYKQVDVLPVVDSVSPTFGKGATFELSQGSVTPSSIRMYAS